MGDNKNNGIDSLHKSTEGNGSHKNEPQLNSDAIILKNVVKEAGLDVDKINIGGEVKPFDELTDEQKYNITREVINSQIESSAQLPEPLMKAAEIIQKEGMPIEDVIEKKAAEIIETKENADGINVDFIKNLNDEDAYLLYLKDKYKDKSEEEIVNLYNEAKELSSFEDDSKKAKEVLLEKYELIQDEAKSKLRKQWEEKLEEERHYIVNDVLSKVPNIGVLKLFENDYNDTFEDILEVDEDGASRFFKEINSSPENLFKAAWLYKNGETEIGKLKDYYEQRISALEEELKANKGNAVHVPDNKKSDVKMNKDKKDGKDKNDNKVNGIDSLYG